MRRLLHFTFFLLNQQQTIQDTRPMQPLSSTRGFQALSEMWSTRHWVLRTDFTGVLSDTLQTLHFFASSTQDRYLLATH